MSAEPTPVAATTRPGPMTFHLGVLSERVSTATSSLVGRCRGATPELSSLTGAGLPERDARAVGDGSEPCLERLTQLAGRAERRERAHHVVGDEPRHRVPLAAPRRGVE